MRRFAGACRFVFNKALAWQNEQYAVDKAVKFSYTTLANLLPLWKQDPAIQWLKESPSQPLQQTLKDLERAYKNFFANRIAFAIRKAASSTKAITEFSCQNWAGWAIATAEKR